MGKFRKKIGKISNVHEEIASNPSKITEIDGGDDSEEEETVPKWFEEFPLKPPSTETLTEEQLASLRIEAQTVLDEETKFYVTKSSKRKGGANSAWMKTVMAKGTANDKVAASVVVVQNSPIHSLTTLNQLVNSVKVSKKKECMLIMETLCDLFVEDLLRTGLKLRPFAKQPLAKIDELTSGCARSRRRWLAAWMFEEKLKELYGNFIAAVNNVAKDTVDSNRIKAVTILNKMLIGHPEQEQVLLQSVVNKLGDPSQKVVSKVIYCLSQLLRIHPNMKQIVLDEIEKLLFRPHISQRAQYYGVCCLSQYLFSNNDRQLARNIIEIYFSFFKALIKKGDVDSRMMGALLMGVKRAYPFAKLEEGSLTQHIDTLYKLVHLSKFNIALHALCLLQEVSGSNQDRFYSALYKKLLDPSLGKSCHHAMFINLIYKSLSKDTNPERVKAIVKRLFQLCLYFPVPVVCALLYMISQLIAKRKKLLFSDVLTPQINISSNLEDDGNDDEVYLDADKSATEETTIKEENNDVAVKKDPDAESKPLRGWVHYEFDSNSWTSNNKLYDPFHRNPAYAKAEKTAYVELIELAKHFHPTVSLFISRILNQETIKYDGDPLSDFTLSRFLERFVFKNPKHASHDEQKGPDPLLASRKYYQPSGARNLNVTSSNYLQQDENDIPVDERFLYRYLKEKYELRKQAGEDDDDDNDSVASEQFEELLDKMMGGKKKDLDFMEEIGDTLQKKTKGKDKSEDSDDNEEADENSEDDAAAELDELADMSDIDVDDGEDDDEVLDFDEDEAGGGFDGDIDFSAAFDEEMTGRSKKRKKADFDSKPVKRKKSGLEGLFAPAEEFAEILEEAGTSKQKQGMHSTLSTKDNAAHKQLDWEKKRDMWVRDRGNFKKKWKGKTKNTNRSKGPKRPKH
ncbi:CBF/Mak21 family [Nesidiocoris tenuis]|uniref:CBF/Mak21 family n=1 Tax=Nesidiocoris tenuis TaxID=355587 RepID=A0ABN7AA22_9HEMI|nr:CBF/Mak21 family [Nesidiocoris tenuis]